MGCTFRKDGCAKKQKRCLQFVTHSPPIHLLTPVTLHPSISNRQPKRNATFMFHSSALRLLLLHWCQSSTSVAFVVFSSLVFVFLSCVLFLHKKSYSFLFQCVSQSVCLCPFGRLPGCLAAGGKWGHPVGDLIKRILRGEALPLAPCGPNRRGLVLLSFSSHSFCLSVCLCGINVFSFCLPSCKDVIPEVGEVSLSPLCVLFST